MIGENRNSTALSLVSIYEISKILCSSLDLERTLRDVLNLLSSYLQMRRGMVALKGPDGHLNVLAAAGMSPMAVRHGAARLPRGVAERIISSEMPFVAPNVAEDPMLADHQAMMSPPDDDERVSFIGVPVKTTGKPFGVLAVDRVWTPDNLANFEADVRFLVMVANLIGQAVKLHRSVADDRELLLADSLRQQKALDQPAAPRMSGPSDPLIGENVIGVSGAMRQVFAQVHQVAPSRSTVLLRGESGTGKELIARAVHDLSRVKDGPFIKVNCAALPETLLESELFGHDKGAFTGATQDRKGRFELAHGGTLFLDEIGEISRAFQAKLLRVLQEGEFERVGGSKTIKVNVRLVCATNCNLEEAVAKGDFRGDLYFRINVVPLFIPPLRERPEDVPALADLFLRRFNEENGRKLRFSERALRVMVSCKFPGNVRELENCVNRVATMTRGEVIEDIDLPCQTNHCLSKVLWHNTISAMERLDCDRSDPDGGDLALADPLTLIDGPPDGDLADMPRRDRLVQAMEKAGWVQAKAARLLGLTPRQLGYALRKYNIEIKRI